MIVIVSFLSIIVTLYLLRFAKLFFKKYDIGLYYINKEEEALERQRMQESMANDGGLDITMLRPDDYSHAMDLRGAPTHLCPCGCNIWNVKVIFEHNEIATYFLDMECANCGSMATAPTPVDKGYTN
jgi:hypothetical protein